MPSSKKLYIITRKDLSPGLQAAQAAHAMAELIFEFPEKAQDWYNDSNYIVILSVDDQEALFGIAKKLQKLPIRWSMMREPDLDNELTAISILPNGHSEKLLSSLPLALREVVRKG